LFQSNLLHLQDVAFSRQQNVEDTPHDDVTQFLPA